MFFRFPPDARWNPERSLVEFGIGVGEYEGVVRISRRVFQILLPETPTPERCLEAYQPQAVDGRWECRDHRSRSAGTRGRTGSAPDWLSPGRFMTATKAFANAKPSAGMAF